MNNILFSIFNYQISLLEFIGSISLILSVYLAAKNNIYNWLFSIINLISFFFIFYQNNLYFQTILQIYFLFNCIYGIFYWKDNNHYIKHINKKELIIYSTITIIGSIISYIILNNFNSANFKILDTLIFILNIIGTILLSRKIYENWYIWILVNILSCCLYFNINLYILSIESLIFIIINIYALKKWKKLITLKKL